MHVDVAVAGAGPAGRFLADRAAARGYTVALVDPAPDRPWQATYAAWTDELPDWLPETAVATHYAQIDAVGHQHTTIHRGYTVLDTAGLQQAAPCTDVHIITGRVDELTPASLRLDSGDYIRARWVIDARGAGKIGGAAQTAFGVTIPSDALGVNAAGARPVLMDWRGNDDQVVPSFRYVLPLRDGTTLIEETVLAASPAVPVRELQRRLTRYLAGIDRGLIDQTSDVERVYIPLTGGGRVPWRHQPQAIGVAAGFVHPATGYSIAASLSFIDSLLDGLYAGLAVREVAWSRQARLVHRLRHRGLSALLGLNNSDTRTFFDAFFSLEIHHQRAYLSSRDDVGGVAAAMATLMPRLEPRLAAQVISASIRG